MASASINFYLHLLFHLLAFHVSGFAAFYEFFYITSRHQGFPGKFRYLTFWNICFQTVYFFLCLVCDLTSGTSGKPSKSTGKDDRGTLQSWRDYFHATVAFPTTMFVAVSFWLLYAIDRELVFPKALDLHFPTWLNHLLHTTILPFIVTEKFLCCHHYPRRRSGFLGVFFLAFVYMSIILSVAYFDDFWVYPILKVLSLPWRVAFIASSFFVFIVFYLFGEKMTGFLWGSSSESLHDSKVKVKRDKKKPFKSI